MSFSEFPYKATIKREVVTESYPNPDVVVTNTIFTGYVDFRVIKAGGKFTYGTLFQSDYLIMFNTPPKHVEFSVGDLVSVNYNGTIMNAVVAGFSYSQLGKTTLYLKDNQINR